RRLLAPSPKSNGSLMHLTGVDSSFPTRSTPRRQCRHKSPTARLKPSDACCQNCASWTDTSAALLRSASERFAVFTIEEILRTIYSCTSAKLSQFLSIYAMACKTRLSAGPHRARVSKNAFSRRLLQSQPALAGPRPRGSADRSPAKARRLLTHAFAG